MTLPQRLSPFRLRWTIRLGTAAFVALIGVLILLGSWGQAGHYAKKRVAQVVVQLSKRLGTPVLIGAVEVSPNGLTVEDLRIGPEAQIVISRIEAELNLNPFAPGWLELGDVRVGSLRLKMTEASLRGMAQEGNGEGKSNEASAPKLERYLAKLFQGVPTRHLTLAAPEITLLTPSGEPSFQLLGLSLAVDRDLGQVLVQADRLTTQSGLNERFLVGRFELSPASPDYRFFINSKAKADARGNLWSASGAVAKDLANIQINAAFHRRPQLLMQLLKDQPVDLTRLRSRLQAELTKTAVGWQFTTQLQSLGSTVRLPLISSRELGPLYFEVKAVGSYATAARTLTLDSATLTMPSRTSRTYGDHPVRFAGHLQATLSGDGTKNLTGRGQLSLPPTPCQDLLEASPEGLLPALEDFKLAGDASAAVDFELQSKNLDQSRVTLEGGQFNCTLREAPYAFSAEHLSGPLLVERRLSAEGPQLTVKLDRLAPNFASFAAIGKNAQNAFVSSEDAAFYLHKGIDAQALASALKKDLAEGRVAAGGSTITMQTVKNLFLSPERTLARKVQELFLAWHLERTLTKERILELYMNVAELGPGIYGIGPASEHFFGKPSAELTLLESAYLATLLPSPKIRYRYFCKGDLTPNYRELVHGLLRRMLSLGRISPERFHQAINSTLHFNDEQRLASKDCALPQAKADSAFLLRRGTSHTE